MNFFDLLPFGNSTKESRKRQGIVDSYEKRAQRKLDSCTNYYDALRSQLIRFSDITFGPKNCPPHFEWGGIDACYGSDLDYYMAWAYIDSDYDMDDFALRYLINLFYIRGDRYEDYTYGWHTNKDGKFVKELYKSYLPLNDNKYQINIFDVDGFATSYMLSNRGKDTWSNKYFYLYRLIDNHMPLDYKQILSNYPSGIDISQCYEDDEDKEQDVELIKTIPVKDLPKYICEDILVFTGYPLSRVYKSSDGKIKHEKVCDILRASRDEIEIVAK